MRFQRVTAKVLPNGETSIVYPFHICTLGQEDRIIFRSDEDLRVAHNYLPICARRSNVIIITDCVLNTHIHAAVLAKSMKDAERFIRCYKISTSMYLSNKYDIKHGIFREVDSSPIFIDEDRYLRNVICYILRNSLDMGIRVDKYRWSGYRSLFCEGRIETDADRVADMSLRQIKETLRVGGQGEMGAGKLADVGWMISNDFVIEPASYCDWHYAESAFNGDVSFFTKVLGMTDNEQMDQMLIYDHIGRKSTDELMAIIEGKCVKRYGYRLSALTEVQKIPIVKSVFYSTRASPGQLARCFGLSKIRVESILNRK